MIPEVWLRQHQLAIEPQGYLSAVRHMVPERADDTTVLVEVRSTSESPVIMIC